MAYVYVFVYMCVCMSKHFSLSSSMVSFREENYLTYAAFLTVKIFSWV